MAILRFLLLQVPSSLVRSTGYCGLISCQSICVRLHIVPESMEQKQERSKIAVVVKNPGRTQEVLTFELDPDASLNDVQIVISQRYEGRPSPQEQTLIHAGRVLKDSSLKLRDLLTAQSTHPVIHFHLVVRTSNQESMASQAGQATQSPRQILAPGPSFPPAPSLPAARSVQEARPTAAAPSGSSQAGPSSSTAVDPGTSSSQSGCPVPPLPDSTPLYPYLFVNPVYAAAYQAAFAAALATASSLHRAPSGSQQSPNLTSPMLPSYPFAFYYPGAVAGAVPSVPLQQSAQAVNMAPAVPFGYMPMSFPALAQAAPQRPVGQGAEPNDNVARNRLAPGMPQQLAQQPQPRLHHRPRRQYQVVFRISARTLLQILVFAVFLYQHFTWQRFVLLVCGSAILYVTANWAPLRNFMFGIGTPTRPNQPNTPVQQQQRGFLRELTLILVGFVTSLLPAWNYNPEDAAAFAAAQEAVAREQRNGEAGGEQPEREAVGQAREHQD